MSDIADVINKIDINRLLLILGVLVIFAAAGMYIAVPDSAERAIEIALVGIGMVTYGKAGVNGKEIKTTVTALKEVVLCDQPFGTCKSQKKMEVPEDVNVAVTKNV